MDQLPTELTFEYLQAMLCEITEQHEYMAFMEMRSAYHWILKEAEEIEHEVKRLFPILTRLFDGLIVEHDEQTANALAETYSLAHTMMRSLAGVQRVRDEISDVKQNGNVPLDFRFDPQSHSFQEKAERMKERRKDIISRASYTRECKVQIVNMLESRGLLQGFELVHLRSHYS